MNNLIYERINEKTINNIKQNKIKYIVRDFAEYGVPEDVTREILLKRGINKWLANRMAIIGLKNDLKQNIRDYLSLMYTIKVSMQGKQSLYYKEILGSLKAVNRIRQEIRKICHSSRWQFPE